MKGNTSRAGCLAWGILATILTVAGCQKKLDRPFESIDSPLVHTQYQGDAAQEQIEALEADVEDIKAEGGVVPPDYYAQLGLLYFSLGKTEQQRQRLKAEQDPFADSTAAMSDLMNSTKAAEQSEPVDPPVPPEELTEPPARTDFSRERSSFVRAFLRSEARPLIF